MYWKTKLKGMLILGLLYGFIWISAGAGFAHGIADDGTKEVGGIGIYLTVSMALLLTGLTLLAISLLARYIKSIQGDPFNNLEDSES